MFLLTILFFQKKKLKCLDCGSLRGSLAQMKKHQKAHLEDKIRKCRVCEKIYDDDNHLEEHEDKHVLEPRYHCMIVSEVGQPPCGKKYMVKGSLRTHMCNAHDRGLVAGSYLTDENVQWETKDDYLKCRTKQKVIGSFKIEYI